MKEEMLSQEEAAQMLGVSRTTMHRMLKSGQLKGLKAGGQWRFRPADVLAHLERGPAPLSPLALEGVEAEIAFFSGLVSEQDATLLEGEDLSGEDSRLLELINALLFSAIKSGASDYHLEPVREGLQVRQRVDGALSEIRVLPSKLGEAIVGRLKILSGMDARQTQLPQEGRIVWKNKEQRVHLYLATMPTLYGEAITVRILMMGKGFSELARMNLRDEQKDELLSWMGRPYGLILVCGPTGSGKDTLAYGLISEMVSAEMKATRGESKVVTIEDPVEFDLPGVLQISCNSRQGLTPVVAARALSRLDPDIVMFARLPETDTAETAAVALDIASSGRLVLMSLEVPSIKQAVAQLLDFEVELIVLESLLLGVVSLRLLRRVCPDCAQTIEIPQKTEALFRDAAAQGGYEMPKHVEWKQGSGCAKCRQAGYTGRHAIYEMTRWNEDLPSFSLRGDGEPGLEEVAQDGGNVLRAEGVRLAVEGTTSPQEVMRVLFSRAI